MPKSKHLILLTFLFIFHSINILSQNTVGTIINTVDSYNGYTLFTVYKETYLIDNCGEVINQWTSEYVDGKSVYLLEDGSILRAGVIANTDVLIPGIGGIFQKFDWDGSLLWEYQYSTSNHTQHHDIYPLPNGNVLILAITNKTNAEAIQAGRDPLLLDGDLYNEQIIEVQQTGLTTGSIEWEWNIWDHLVQDKFILEDNFDVVEDNPQLLDINFLGTAGTGRNWLHCNSIQYNSDLDQIILSFRQLNEIYIIDHSTTTLEAASHSGGTYGKGGDFLYRWGNPQAYKQGNSTNQKLFGQHFPNFIPSGLNDAGKIILFNNGFGRTPSFSEINILSPPTDSPGVYSYTADTAYGPTDFDFSYIDPIDPTNFYSAILSSAQRLPNGNTLMCVGAKGYFFEIDSSENIVWEYINPQSGQGAISAQGEIPTTNQTFRAFKYSPDYAAFTGRDLTPSGTIQTGVELYNCNILNTNDNALSRTKIYPNPTNGIINIKTSNNIDKIEVYNMLGRLVETNSHLKSINLNSLSTGLYIVKIYSNNLVLNKKVIKE